MSTSTLIEVADHCWRCETKLVELRPNVHGSFHVHCAMPHCISKTSSGKSTPEKALKQWSISARRERSKRETTHARD